MEILSALIFIGSIFGTVLIAHGQEAKQLDTGDVGELRPADSTKFYKEAGYLPYAGKHHEKIFDVAWGDANKRKPGADGKLPPVGNTVDLATSWTACDAAYFKVKITDPKVPLITQERAFTSPIWYTP
jgi:Protein of unknown function (DUF3604)